MTVTPTSIEWQARAGEARPAVFSLYFLENMKQEKEETTESVEATTVVEVSGDADEHCFSITCQVTDYFGNRINSMSQHKTTFHLSCDSLEQKANWVNKIRTVSGLTHESLDARRGLD